MAIRVIDDSKLQDIAVAIQGKDSGGTMTVDEMPTRIANIPSGGTLIPKTITQNGVYNASSDNADGYDVVTVDVPEKNTLDDYFANTLEVADISSATSITDGFFRNKSSLINVIMPNVTRIDNSAFRSCTNLALTVLPDGVTSIGASAFDGCKNLALTVLPDGITSIGNNAFYGCTNLALTVLPDGITSIGNSAFYGCTNLALTSLPSGVTSIGDYAVNGCTNLALTVLPDGITSIGGNAFSGCINLALTSLPSGVTSIGKSAFYNCTSIPYLDFSVFTQIPTVWSTSFANTSFPFYFRDQQQLDEWAAATNWSTYAGRFQIKPSGVI